MTQPQPQPSPWDAISPSDERDALHSVSQMLTGTKMLASEPGVVYALHAAQAQPADAQAIDQFMQGLDAEKMVQVARSAGSPIILSEHQKRLLDLNGVPYQDVVHNTNLSIAQSAQQRITTETNGKFTAKLNANGTLALGSNGQIQLTALEAPQQAQPSGGGGFWGSVGGFFSHVGHDATNWAWHDTTQKAVTGATKAFNFVNASLGGSGGIDDLLHPSHVGQNLVASTPDVKAMQESGYDPNSPLSFLAYLASGHAVTNLTPLYQKYGQDKVDQAVQFLDNPGDYRQKFEKDANNFVTVNGQTVMTPQAKASLHYLDSPEFQNIATEVQAHSATVGNSLANDLGLNPLSGSTVPNQGNLYNRVAGLTNIAASLAIDPTYVGLSAMKVAKLADVGIDTLGDSTRAAEILASPSKLHYVRNVQRGWQRAIDLGDQFRQAAGKQDAAGMAATTAQFRAELPALEPLWENFTGGTRVFRGFHPTDTAIVDGHKIAVPVFGPSDGIRSLGEAADFVRSNYGMTRLMSGRAATQASLMPGALSMFGYRKVKGLVAGWMTGRSATRAEGAYNAVLSAAEADPALAEKLINEKMLLRLPPTADDAVDFHGNTILAEPAPSEGGFASQQRGQLQLTPAGMGQVTRNLRATGSPLGDSTLNVGYFSPTAVAARFRLAAQRLSTMTPRSTSVNLADARSGETLYRFALTYLNRGDANTLRAVWNLSDGGQRKVLIQGLLDQVAHAAGIATTESGQNWLNKYRTAAEGYASDGNDIMLNGRPVSPFEGMTSDQWTLPTFRQLHLASAKLGLWEATMGRPLTSVQMDGLMSQWKMDALFKPSTWSRNMLEGWLRTALDGRAGDAVKSRMLLTARNKDLWAQGVEADTRDLFIEQRNEADRVSALLKQTGLSRDARAVLQGRLAEAQRKMATVEERPIVQHLLATETGDTGLAKQIERGSMLSGQILGRSTPSTAVANWLVPVGRAYRSMFGRHMSQEDVDAFFTLSPGELQDAMEGYSQQILVNDVGNQRAAKDATEVAQAGWGPAKYRWNVHRAIDRGRSGKESGPTVWAQQALDGTRGMDAYAAALARRVNAMPETARAAIDHLGDPDMHPLSGVVDALEKESKLTAFGRVAFDDPTGAPLVARVARNEQEANVGKAEWANRVVQEYKYLLTGQNGRFQTELADYIREHGKAPDSGWIGDHVTADNRPESALAPDTMAMPAGGLRSIPQTLQDVQGGSFQWMVERLLQRTTSSPVFMANYVEVRKGLNPMVEHMVGDGFEREAAENLAKDLAIRQSWVKTEQLIDDPGQRTQFDILARNMIPFSRATQAMIRRWGAGLWQNPAQARRMMLAYEGAVHSGLIYNNVYGEPTFTYPGSGVLNMALREIAKVPGFENIAAFPVSASMTGGVLMSVPGADNPLRMSMGPMLSIPFREIYKHLLPTAWQGTLTRIDSDINGPIGVGETWVQLLPTAARHFYQAKSRDQRNSALASSMIGALTNLSAAGLVPPPDATDAQLNQFRSRLTTQVQSQLWVRFALGLFAPAAPSTPTEGVPQVGADYAFSVAGIHGLSDEYRTILNDVSGDVGRANAIFTALHPDEVVYGPGARTGLTSSAVETAQSASPSGAYLPPTTKALDWMVQHKPFIDKFTNVAAYFLPAETTGQPFSDAAYQTQLELGLRQRKTPEEFLNDVYVKHAEAIFYPTVAMFDAKIQQAKNAGDSTQDSYWTQAKSQWEKEYKTLNPAFGAKIDSYGDARVLANKQLGNLRQMVTEGAVPDSLGPKLGLMLQAYDNYVTFTQQNPGETTEARTVRSNALGMVNAWAERTFTGSPLASVWNGVFRVLNTNLTTLPEASS